MTDITRRSFLELGGAVVAAGAVGRVPDDAAAAAAPFAAPPIETVRIGFVGIQRNGLSVATWIRERRLER